MGTNTRHQFRDSFINAASLPDAMQPPAYFVDSTHALRPPSVKVRLAGRQERTGSYASSWTSCALADTVNSSPCWREYSFDGPFNARSKLFKSLAGEGWGCSTFVQRNRLWWRISASWPKTGSRRSLERCDDHLERDT